MATRIEADAGAPGAGERILRGHRPFRLLPFLGPAFIASVAYVDPGNFATNIAAGSKFGYTLVWVIVAANLIAMLIQTLSAKLGIATGRNLPELCRDHFSRRTAIALWIHAEAIAMATDLAEFLGAAIGFHLLFGIGLFPAAVLTGVTAFLILGLQNFGFRPFEAVIAAIVVVIGACYVAELYYAKPSVGTVAKHAFVPEFAGHESVLLAVGMLVMAASVFWKSGMLHIESLESAHRTLRPILGSASSALFALALIGSGLSSATVGTLAGQVVMQGFIRRKIPVFVRRAVTMVPALVVIGIGVDPSRTLVLSQVVLSFGIPFAVIPLAIFTSKRAVMGDLTNRRGTVAVTVAVTALICAVNVYLLAQTFGI